jgi:putative membrane protein
VTSAANTGEIAQAEAALPKLSNAPAKEFATSMIEMHGAAQSRQSALLQRKQITPQENPTSTALKQESDAIVAALMAASATDVDRLYIDKQVAVHSKVLTLLSDVLIPSADDSELRAELTVTRGEVEMHLKRAEQIKAALAAP